LEKDRKFENNQKSKKVVCKYCASFLFIKSFLTYINL
jgi:DNA-directed RNA polymerase subunit RPC12/RpoP